jgi:hypothetical protein
VKGDSYLLRKMLQGRLVSLLNLAGLIFYSPWAQNDVYNFLKGYITNGNIIIS